MGAGGLLSGLVQGYATQRLKKMDLEHGEEQQDKQNRVSYLQAAIGSGKLTPDAMNAALDELGEITGDGGKKKEGGGGIDLLKKLAGHVQQQQKPTPFEQRVQPTGGSQERTLGDVPQPERQAATAVQGVTGSLGKTPTPPSRKVFKTSQDEADEKIAEAKRMQQEVTGPAEKQRADEEAARQAARDKDLDEREAAREKATADRAEATQHALDVRLKNQEGFQATMERIRQAGQDNRERMRDAAQFRLSDSKAGDALDKIAQTERAKNISGTLADMQKQLTQASSLLKARESEAQKQSWYQFWKDSPDTQSAKEDIDNAKAAIDFLTIHKTNVISGKEDMDEITAKTEDIMRNGQPTWSRAAWSTANPGKDVEAASLAAQKQGMKVVP